VLAQSVCAPLESDPTFILRHGYTYSGHAVACAAAHANIDALQNEGLLGRVQHIGQRIETALSALAADGTIAGVRGCGAVWAAALRADQDAMAIRDRMLELGAITRAINDANTFCPPLVITDDELDTLLDAFATAASGR
ncbi:MAG: aminotransferase class III-fold pyridoxal phosphate-dependent enzyme, partial [Actinomycetota bacterium]